MKKINQGIVAGFFLSLMCTAYAGTNSPVGYWKTIDDVTGQTKSIVKIEEQSNHVLSGKVVSLFRDATKICTQCTGTKKNQPILGMRVMEGLKQSQDTANLWHQGEILDPKTGKQYHCNIQLMESGQRLQVRGFIGIPLFGRTQTWVRVKEPV